MAERRARFGRREARLDLDRAGLAADLKRLREEASLVGVLVAKRAGISQGKLSKIETASVVPSVADVRAIASALKAPAATVDSLVRRAEALQSDLSDVSAWSQTRGRLADAQRDFGTAESQAQVIRNYERVYLPGLLQTAEYARGILAAAAALVVGPDAPDVLDIPAAVAARMDRQTILYETRRRFYLLLHETVFDYQPCRPDSMRAQIDRVRQVAGLTNVTLRFVPRGVEKLYLPTSGFVLLDDATALVELASTAVSTNVEGQVDMYRRVFDDLYDRASPDVEPFLVAAERRLPPS